MIFFANHHSVPFPSFLVVSSEKQTRIGQLMQRRSLLVLLLNGLARALPSFKFNDDGGLHTNGHPTVERGSPEFWYKIIISGALVLLGGVFAG